MRYEIDFVESALEQLRALPKDARRLIGAKLDRAQHDLTGDIKKAFSQYSMCAASGE